MPHVFPRCIVDTLSPDQRGENEVDRQTSLFAALSVTGFVHCTLEAGLTPDNFSNHTIHKEVDRSKHTNDSKMHNTQTIQKCIFPSKMSFVQAIRLGRDEMPTEKFLPPSPPCLLVIQCLFKHINKQRELINAR